MRPVLPGRTHERLLCYFFGKNLEETCFGCDAVSKGVEAVLSSQSMKHFRNDGRFHDLRVSHLACTCQNFGFAGHLEFCA